MIQRVADVGAMTCRLTVYALMLTAAGCGCDKPSHAISEAIAEKTIEAAARAHGQDVKVDLDVGPDGVSRVTVAGQDGIGSVTTTTREGRTEVVAEGPGGRQTTRVGDRVTISESFPKDVPLPPDLTPTAAIHDESGPSWTVQGTLPVKLAEVRAFYVDRLPKAGWVPLTSLDTTELLSLTFEKNDRVLSVMAGPEGTGTTLSVAVSVR